MHRLGSKILSLSFILKILKKRTSVCLIMLGCAFLYFSLSNSNSVGVKSATNANTRMDKTNLENIISLVQGLAPKDTSTRKETTVQSVSDARLKSLSKTYKVKEIVCESVINAWNTNTRNKSYEEAAKVIAKVHALNTALLNDSYYMDAAANCKHFVETRGYFYETLSPEEADFPIAYSLVVFKDIEMVERLFRSIYRSQNYYCIHVDTKADASFYRAVEAVVGCFENAFVASQRTNVTWGDFSVLEPEFTCMRDLWGYKKWKYFINLTGQEFPLKTNLELVRILTAFNGANDVEGAKQREKDSKRWEDTPIPAGITPRKGAVHVVINRQFVDYVLHNETSQHIQAWLHHVKIPDESFFSTLNHNPHLGVPGAYTGIFDTNYSNKPFLARYKNWFGSVKPCAGEYKRHICILTTGDLPQLGNYRKELFANKFYINEDQLVIGCLEELLFNRTRDQLLGRSNFNASYYTGLDFVLNQVSGKYDF